MNSKSQNFNLYIHEVAPAAWKWINNSFTDKQKFLGLILECLPKHSTFDLIYLATIDYAFDDASLISFMSALKPFLNENGKILLISSSLQSNNAFSIKSVFSLVNIKSFILEILDRLNIHDRFKGQFWGWKRTKNEYRKTLRKAGYQSLEEGTIRSAGLEFYWISGC